MLFHTVCLVYLQQIYSLFIWYLSVQLTKVFGMILIKKIGGVIILGSVSITSTRTTINNNPDRITRITRIVSDNEILTMKNKCNHRKTFLNYIVTCYPKDVWQKYKVKLLKFSSIKQKIICAKSWLFN